ARRFPHRKVFKCGDDTHKQKIKRNGLFHTVDFSAYDASVWAFQLDESFPNDLKSRNRVFRNPARLPNIF
ncbi:hypothetical protein, partial [Halobacillus sp. BBL2006]|uniref:hypothetical protein n=1 Tax=Halobacillus sp. BBL2006 TaxID=1543706 RepID=UPI0005441E99